MRGAKIDEGYTHIVFRDNRTGDNSWEVYYKRNPEFSNILATILATIVIVGIAERIYIQKKV